MPPFNNLQYMELALQLAREAPLLGEVPVAAVIVHEGVVLAAGHNLTKSSADPTAHAEVLQLRQAAKILGSAHLTGCDLYVTLEPCPMCAYAISLAKIRRLYYGAEDAKGGGVVNGPRIFNSTSCHHSPEIYSGIMAEASSSLLRDFFAAKRKNQLRMPSALK